MTRYVIITPVRDEEKYVRATINSVCNQTTRPAEWVIVNDGSTDRTADIIDGFAAQFPWIRALHRPNRGFRKPGGGVVEAFYDGYHALQCDDWEFVVKLDGDLTFAPDYFEKCFEHFRLQPRLGMGGGEIYHDQGGELKLESCPRFHVRGATKIYKRACWEEIGGLMPMAGWDTIDEVKAGLLGWKTTSFPDLRLVHHRLTGAADGHLRDCMKYGLVSYSCGYHPVFFAARCVSRLVRRPYVTGSAAMCYGFLKGHITRAPRVSDHQLIDYLRTQQLRRLCGLETIWK